MEGQGWFNDPYEHSLAARGMRSRGMVRAYRPLLKGRIKSLRTSEQDTLVMLYDQAYEYLEKNGWSKGRAIKELDAEYKYMKMTYKNTHDPELRYEMDLNEDVQSLIGFTPVDTIMQWPELREEKIRKHGL